MDCSGYEMLTCMFLCPCPPWIYINGHYARLLRNLENAHASLFYITFLTIPFFVSRKPTHHVTRAGFIHIGKRLDKNSLCSSAYFLGRPCTAKGTEFMQLTSSWPKTKSQLLTFSVTGFRFKKHPKKFFIWGKTKGDPFFCYGMAFMILDMISRLVKWAATAWLKTATLWRGPGQATAQREPADTPNENSNGT